MEAFLLTHADQGLRSAIPGLLGLDMPRCCSWGVAVGHIRERSSSFADLNLKARKRGLVLQAGGIRSRVGHIYRESDTYTVAHRRHIALSF